MKKKTFNAKRYIHFEDKKKFTTAYAPNKPETIIKIYFRTIELSS